MNTISKNYIKQLQAEIEVFTRTEKWLLREIDNEYDFFIHDVNDLIVDENTMNPHITRQKELIKTLRDIMYIRAEKVEMLNLELETNA